jgi:GT2 family glycosyltransferase
MSCFASVLIVNYNSGHHLNVCLEALRKQTYPHFEIIIVDNSSSDDSIADTSGSDVRIINLKTNVGFAEGNNIAAQHASGDPLVLLNPDTIPDLYWLEELLATMTKRNASAAVSKLVFGSDPTIINSGGLELLRDGRGADTGFQQLDVGQFETEREVFAGCGAALAVRRSVFEMTSSLFLYYEDLDLGWRLRQAGASVWYSPRSLVLHAVGAAIASPVHRYYVERNRALTAIRHADLWLAMMSIIVLMLKVPQALLKGLTGRLPLRTAFAVPRAFLSLLMQLPQTLTQRYVNRMWRLR